MPVQTYQEVVELFRLPVRVRNENLEHVTLAP